VLTSAQPESAVHVVHVHMGTHIIYIYIHVPKRYYDGIFVFCILLLFAGTIILSEKFRLDRAKLLSTAWTGLGLLCVVDVAC
jgi:hypothetical protein